MEHSRKGYCIVRDVISAAATVLQQSAAWKGTSLRKLKMSIDKTEVG